MKFHEHIIRASIPELPFQLTREALARGIAGFARHPEHYIEEVSGSRITSSETVGAEPGSVVFGREIRFGALVFEERIELTAAGDYRAHVEADGPRPASDFTMTIEEPVLGSLFVRFTYHEDRPEAPETSLEERQLAQLRRLAYESKDRSILSKILEDLIEEHASGRPA